MDKKNIPRYILFTLLGGLIGATITFLFMDNMDTNTNKCRVSVNNSKFEPVFEAYETLKSDYYKDLDDNVLIDGMIDGMMEATGDKHTSFFNAQETKDFLEEMSGEYYGIGALIYQTEDNNVSISKVFKDSPAKKAGLQIGDMFISINGESALGKTPDEVSKILRSSDNKIANVVVKRGEEELSFEIEKSMIEITSVESEVLDNNIGYIGISTFSSLTDNQFTEELNNLEKQGIDSLIIDLRGNGGGYLSTVTNIISRFVDRQTPIYQIKSRDNTEVYYSLNDSKLDYKLVILIDENSASASEIMCSALKEQYDAILVGKTTYGKGTVQEMHNLTNNTMFKYTTEEWLSSEGNTINDVGVKPDYEVELGEEYFSDPTMENDAQLQKAIELLK